MKQKIDFLQGLERTQRTRPRALPRTPAHDDDAIAATDALAFVADDNRYEQIRSRVWKDILTAAFKLELRMAPALIGGGFVMLGVRTSKYGKREMGDFLTFVKAEGDTRGVRWSAPARDRFDEYIPRGVEE